MADWETVTELIQKLQRLSFSAAGSAWDAPREEHFFYQNGSDVFHVVLHCYQAAEEGNGTRLRRMLDTFVILPVGGSQMEWRRSRSDNLPGRPHDALAGAAAAMWKGRSFNLPFQR